MVLNHAAIAQIHVPYDDNGARYHDISDYGIGGNNMVTLSDNQRPSTLIGVDHGQRSPIE